MFLWSRTAGVATAAFLFCLCCTSEAGRPPKPGTRKEEKHLALDVVFSAKRGLGNGWQDYGWAPRKFAAGAPAELDLSNHAGWIIGQPGLKGQYGGLGFKLWAPAGAGDFLEVRLDSSAPDIFPRVLIGPGHRRDLPDGWTEIWIPMSELDPKRAPFDRLVLRAAGSLPSGSKVKVDELAFTGDEGQGTSNAAITLRNEPVEVRMAVDCVVPRATINPMIYGIAYSAMRDADEAHQWKAGATARRWGGNPTSRYNWQLGNAWNTASDWFFRNVNYTPKPNFTYDDFLDDDLAHGVQTALTVPTIGWVAKDTTSVSFPAETFGRQQYMAPENQKIGNGVGLNGKPIPPGPPTATSVPAPPEFIEEWVREIRKKDATRGRSVHQYILDNEPALWNSTHRDVHPEPLTYDGLLEKTIAYGEAVRRADPEAVIAGPAEWGWTGYLFSAADQAAGFHLRPDRLKHFNEPLVPWLLRKVREREKETKTRILDVLDLHYYPQGSGIGVGTKGATDSSTNALRIRSTRSLWDSAYTDESWISDTIRLLPRMKEWIAKNAPGLGISIGEWNFGAEGHMSGGLATAEALGRFGQYGVTSAFYWDYPPLNSPAFWAFRAYRNFDGKGGRFLDRSVPTMATFALSSAFASMDDSGQHLVMVLLNMDPSGPLRAQIDLASCGKVVSSKAYSYAGDPKGFAPAEADPHTGVAALSQVMAAYSITVVDAVLESTRTSTPTPP